MKKQLCSWKNSKKKIKCKKKEIVNLTYKQGLLFEKSKESDQGKVKKNGVSKTRRSVKKVTKTQSGNKFKEF